MMNTEITKFISEIRKVSEMSDEQIRKLLISVSTEKPEVFEIVKRFNLIKLSSEKDYIEKDYNKSTKESKFVDSGIDTCNLGYFNDKGCDY